jgi:hypothetical protein
MGPKPGGVGPEEEKEIAQTVREADEETARQKLLKMGGFPISGTRAVDLPPGNGSQPVLPEENEIQTHRNRPSDYGDKPAPSDRAPARTGIK